MKIFPRAHRHRPTSWVVLVPLVGTLALALGLGYQAFQADRSHRSVAEGVLRDYAAFAAAEAVRVARRDLEAAVNHTLRPHGAAPIYRRMPGPQPPPSTGGGGHMDCACVSLEPVDGFFRYDRSTDRLVTLSGRVSLDSTALKAALGQPGGRLSSLFVDEAGRIVGVVAENGSRGSTVVGFEAPASALAPVFQRITREERLLPETLTTAGAFDSLITLEVRDDRGRTIYDSAMPRAPLDLARDRSAFVSQKPLPAPIDGLQLRVSLNDAAADRLIIGGLPKSRLPTLLGLLVLTVAMTAVASWQLWRERELARLRETFVSSVSHELRTPLAQIRLFVETLRLGRVRSEGERQRAIDIIDEEAARLGHLVENALCFSRGERHVPGDEATSLPLAVTGAVEAFLPLARDRRCTVSVGSIEPAAVRLSADALRQVLLNLLDNAAKFGPPGQTITVSAIRAGHDIRLQIDDEGPGVPAEERARIWEPFYRLDRATERRVPGTGIGLAVVRGLVAPAGGRVSVETSPSGGARFIVHLPGAVAAVLAEDAPAAAPTQIPA